MVIMAVGHRIGHELGDSEWCESIGEDDGLKEDGSYAVDYTS